MAFSSSKLASSIAGNVKMEIHSFDAASVTSGTISAGMSNIFAVFVNNGTTAGQGHKATWSGQLVTISDLTSNDVGQLIILGNG